MTSDQKVAKIVKSYSDFLINIYEEVARSKKMIDLNKKKLPYSKKEIRNALKIVMAKTDDQELFMQLDNNLQILDKFKD